VAGRGAGLLSASRAGTDGPISTIIHISAGGLASQSAGRGAEGALAGFSGGCGPHVEDLLLNSVSGKGSSNRCSGGWSLAKVLQQ
jgi:hypothetical protein